MVGRFTLPSLPSFPAAVYELLDTSPPVFYPASRPSSRPTSSCPPSPHHSVRPVPDEQLPTLPPPPRASHPHTNAPLGYAHPLTDAPLASANLPPRRSSLTPLDTWQVPTPKRPSHRRSHSAAPSAYVQPLRMEPRQLMHTSSTTSLPTLAEDAQSPERPSTASGGMTRMDHILPGRRRRAQSSVTIANIPMSSSRVVPEPDRKERARRHRHSYSINGLTFMPSVSGASTPLDPPGTPSQRRRRGSSVSSLAEVQTAPIAASVSISDIAAVAEWSRAHSPTKSSQDQAGECLRARLRTLSALEGTLQTPRRAMPPPPASTHATPGHGVLPSTPTCSIPGTPGSSTPTTASGHHHAPLSPTPRRHARPLSWHIHRPESERPTTSRLRTAAPLFMGPGDHPPRSRRGSTATLATVERSRSDAGRRSVHPLVVDKLERSRSDASACARVRRSSIIDVPRLFGLGISEPISPLLTSSPGSLVSDHGSVSPTTLVESLPLPFPTPMLFARECRGERAEMHSLPARDRSSRGSRGSMHDRMDGYARPGVTVFVDDPDGERFLDFDDI